MKRLVEQERHEHALSERAAAIVSAAPRIERSDERMERVAARLRAAEAAGALSRGAGISRRARTAAALIVAAALLWLGYAALRPDPRAPADAPAVAASPAATGAGSASAAAGASAAPAVDPAADRADDRAVATVGEGAGAASSADAHVAVGAGARAVGDAPAVAPSPMVAAGTGRDGDRAAASPPARRSRARGVTPVEITVADLEGEAALVRKATLAMRGEGGPKEALALLREYRRKHPGGALTDEALYLAAEAGRLSGDPDTERYAREYLRKFPRGRFRKRVERVLHEIGAAK